MLGLILCLASSISVLNDDAADFGGGHDGHDVQGCGKVTIHHTIGCYNTTIRVLPIEMKTIASADLSLETCAAACAAAGFAIAGVEDGNQCFCGTAANIAAGSARAVDKEECSGIPCSGSRAEDECGGKERLLAYVNTSLRIQSVSS